MELIDGPWIILFLSLIIVICLWISHSQKQYFTNPIIPNLDTYPAKIQPGQPPYVDTSRVSGDRLGPLDPSIYYPPTVAPSGTIQAPPSLSGTLSATNIEPQPNLTGLSHLGKVKIPIDYLPLPYNPALANVNTPNFTSEGLRVDAFFKKQPLLVEGAIPLPILQTPAGDIPLYNPKPGEQPPSYERSMKAGALTSSQYQPDYWTYSNEKIQNGGNWGGILGYEPNASPEAAYPNPRLFPASHGYYPNENPNTNSIGIPKLPAKKDDLRMGLGIPAYQGSFVNERVPM